MQTPTCNLRLCMHFRSPIDELSCWGGGLAVGFVVVRGFTRAVHAPAGSPQQAHAGAGDAAPRRGTPRTPRRGTGDASRPLPRVGGDPKARPSSPFPSPPQGSSEPSEKLEPPGAPGWRTPTKTGGRGDGGEPPAPSPRGWERTRLRRQGGDAALGGTPILPLCSLL